MKQHKILFISYDGMTDPLGQSQVIPYLDGLSTKGYDVSLLSFEKQERFSKNQQNIQKILDKSGIHWYPKTYTKRPPILSTLWDLFKMFRATKKLIKKEGIELIHCRSYISALVGLHFKRKYGTKFLFDMRGFWADERVDGNIWNLKNPIYKLVYNYFKKKELEFLHEADGVVSLTEVAKDDMSTWENLNIAPQKIKVIPCCVDTETFQQNELLKKQVGVLNLCYLGSLGTWYLTEELLDFFERVVTRHPNAHLHIFTPDSPDIVYKLMMKTRLTRHQVSISFAQRRDLPSILSTMDLAVYFVKPSYSKISSSPTKQGELLSMGIPVITNDKIGDSTPIIEGNHIGCVIKDFSPEEFQRAVDSIDVLRKIPKEAIRAVALNIYSLNMGIDKYAELYEEIL